MDILFLLLLLENAVSTITVSVIAPFYPPMAELKGLGTETVGLVLAANPIGAFLASILLAKFLTRGNRVKVLVGGLLVQAVGLLVFVVINFIEDKNIFLALSMAGRLLQGFGVSSQAVPAYALIPLLYPKQLEHRISLMELSSGAGYVAGPLCGAVLFQLGGYAAPFIFFSILLILCAPLIYTQLTKHLAAHQMEGESVSDPILVTVGNDLTKITDVDSSKETECHESKINFKEVFSKWSISLTFLVTILSTFSYMYFEPVQATFLMNVYKVDQEYAGYFMSVVTLTYILGCIVFGHVRLSKRNLLMGGVLLSAITFFFQGPDYNFTKFDHKLWVVIAAQAVLGIGCSMIFIPAMPLLHEILLTMYPKQQEKVGNIASALFNIAVSCGEFMGPLAGGVMTERFGYITGCSYTGFILIGLGLTYTFVFCEQPRKIAQAKSIDSKPSSVHPQSPSQKRNLLTSPKLLAHEINGYVHFEDTLFEGLNGTH